MVKHKLVHVMLERNASRRLRGIVQIDDAYIAGAHPGRRGRGASGKIRFVAAIATTEDGKPNQIILRRVKAFRVGFGTYEARAIRRIMCSPGATGHLRFPGSVGLQNIKATRDTTMTDEKMILQALFESLVGTAEVLLTPIFGAP